jgi:hypothetical protein
MYQIYDRPEICAEASTLPTLERKNYQQKYGGSSPIYFISADFGAIL